MRQSELFTKTSRDVPKDEVSVNAQLLIKAGFVHKLMAGVYSFLPLGLRVLKKIEGVVREEMDAVGGQEILMPALHPREHYIKTGREKIDVLFHVESATGKKMVLGQSHEEVVVPLVKKHVSSYRDLPLYAYQIQTKFRNELRPKSGIFRGLEFLMKDLYSFHENEDDFEEYYERMKGAYSNVFDRVGLGDKTLITHASGGTFSKHSHEFQTLTPAGEDTIHICDRCQVAVNEEVIAELGGCVSCGEKGLKEEKAVEVGNIFPLKSRFSDAFGLEFKDKDGKEKPIIMGCYGIGVSRLMGAIVEVRYDDKGIAWPEGVAPFEVHLVALEGAEERAEEVYDKLGGVEVLYDDRKDTSAGEKFSDVDLIGIPWRVVVSEKTGGKVEVRRRGEDEVKLMEVGEFMKLLDD